MQAIKKALTTLALLGALDLDYKFYKEGDSLHDTLAKAISYDDGRDLTKINSLGELMAKLPINPRFSKMLIVACKYPDILSYSLMITACLSVPELFLPVENSKKQEKQDDSDSEDNKDEDPDLVTSIDIEQKRRKKEMKIKK